MKTSSFKSYALGLILAAAFAAFLLYGTLSSSDFPRGIFGCPVPVPQQNQHWPDFAQLHQNQVRNARWTWYGDNFGADYRHQLSQYDLKAVLAKSDWDSAVGAAFDTVPYWLNYYSCGQYAQYQAELSESQADYLLNVNGSGYYYFEQGQGDTS